MQFLLSLYVGRAASLVFQTCTWENHVSEPSTEDNNLGEIASEPVNGEEDALVEARINSVSIVENENIAAAVPQSMNEERE